MGWNHACEQTPIARYCDCDRQDLHVKLSKNAKRNIVPSKIKIYILKFKVMNIDTCSGAWIN